MPTASRVCAPITLLLAPGALGLTTTRESTPAARGTTFAPVPRPPVPNVVDDPAWLIATSGFCSNLKAVETEHDVETSAEGDTRAHFIGSISFEYYPQAAVKFTDFPHHLAKTIEGDAAEADALVSSSWDHKNIALLEPTSTCGVDEQSNQAWGISVFKVKEHRACADGETAWEGHPCVHYTGYVSAETSNFVMANAGRFVCQLFVDSSSGFDGKVEAFSSALYKCDSACAEGGDSFDYPGGGQRRSPYPKEDAEAMLADAEKGASKAYETIFNRVVIKDSQSYAKAIGGGAELGASGWGASVQVKVKANRNVEVSMSTLVFEATCYVNAIEPAKMKGCPPLSEPAKVILQQGGEAFRKSYGTHFVYGTINRAFARSHIRVETKSEKEKSRLDAELSASYSKPGFTIEGNANFYADLTEKVESSSISTAFYSSGVTGKPDSDSEKDVSTYLFNLANHTATNRGTLLLFPHADCDEYKRLTTFVPSNPSPSMNRQLVEVSAKVDFNWYSYQQQEKRDKKSVYPHMWNRVLALQMARDRLVNESNTTDPSQIYTMRESKLMVGKSNFRMDVEEMRVTAVDIQQDLAKIWEQWAHGHDDRVNILEMPNANTISSPCAREHAKCYCPHGLVYFGKGPHRSDYSSQGQDPSWYPDRQVPCDLPTNGRGGPWTFWPDPAVNYEKQCICDPVCPETYKEVTTAEECERVAKANGTPYLSL